jgi:hypothetical protein
MERDKVEQLLAGTPVVHGACELDLLTFLHRHPRTLLTNEQLAAFVGYPMKQVADVIEAFVATGLVERTPARNAAHAARMYRLAMQGPQGPELRALLDLASSREGRRALLRRLNGGTRPRSAGLAQDAWRLHVIA